MSATLGFLNPRRRSVPNLRQGAASLADLRPASPRLQSKRLDRDDPPVGRLQKEWERPALTRLGTDRVATPFLLRSLSAERALLKLLEDGSVPVEGTAPVKDTSTFMRRPLKTHHRPVGLGSYPDAIQPQSCAARALTGSFTLPDRDPPHTSLTPTARSQPLVLQCRRAEADINQNAKEIIHSLFNLQRHVSPRAGRGGRSS